MIDVSVVMSVFNGGNSLPATLASVLGQERCNFEFIVVDDGSTDDLPNSGRMGSERSTASDTAPSQRRPHVCSDPRMR